MTLGILGFQDLVDGRIGYLGFQGGGSVKFNVDSAENWGEQIVAEGKILHVSAQLPEELALLNGTSAIFIVDPVQLTCTVKPSPVQP